MNNKGVDIQIQKCPICGSPDHVYHIEKFPLIQKGIFFGAEKKSIKRTLILICQSTAKDFADKHFFTTVDTSDPTFKIDLNTEDLRVTGHMTDLAVMEILGKPSQMPPDVSTIPCYGYPFYPAEEALLDAGISQVKGSVTTSQDFHKKMMDFSVAFLTIISTIFLLLLGTTTSTLNHIQREYIAIPISLMIFSCICFSLGYYPPYRRANFDVMESIYEARQKILERRHIYAIIGMTLFVLSIISLFIVIGVQYT